MSISGSLPPYSSIRPEERLCRVSEALYSALDRAYDALEERILLRSVNASTMNRHTEPTRHEAHDLARFEAVFSCIYFDKEHNRTELDSPLNRSLQRTVTSLLGKIPDYIEAV